MRGYVLEVPMREQRGMSRGQRMSVNWSILIAESPDMVCNVRNWIETPVQFLQEFDNKITGEIRNGGK